MYTKERVTTFKERFSDLIAEQPFNATELSKLLGVSRQTISAWKTGERSPKMPTVETIARFFNVDIGWLCGFDVPRNQKEEPLPAKNLFRPRNQRIPLLGNIACGTPILAEENLEKYVDIPEEVHADFALRCKGDSMYPRLNNGDLVLIRQQPDVEDGQIAAVLIGEEATLKRVYHISGGLNLVAENPSFAPMVCIDRPDVSIIGLAVGYQRTLI